jgi:hypothetical protein
MKRLFYSTVAVLAFSVSGMANTIELEVVSTNVENENPIIEIASDLIKKNIDEERGLNCFDFAAINEATFFLFSFAMGVIPTNEMLYSVFSAAYESCM